MAVPRSKGSTRVRGPEARADRRTMTSNVVYSTTPMLRPTRFSNAPTSMVVVTVRLQVQQPNQKSVNGHFPATSGRLWTRTVATDERRLPWDGESPVHRDKPTTRGNLRPLVQFRLAVSTEVQTMGEPCRTHHWPVGPIAGFTFSS